MDNEAKVTEDARESAEKAVTLLAGAEENLKALTNHYIYLEDFITEHLKKVEEEKNIVFDEYIADLLVTDLFVHDMATYIGHFKVFGAKVITKLASEDATEEQKNSAMLKLLRFENEIPKMKDEGYYEVCIDKQIELLLEKAKEKGFEGIVKEKESVEEKEEDSELSE
jgi:hypothetical protein